MNIYELIGRISISHLNCEEIFSRIGEMIDNKKDELTKDPECNFSIEELSILETNLSILCDEIFEYKNLISNYSCYTCISHNFISDILQCLNHNIINIKRTVILIHNNEPVLIKYYVENIENSRVFTIIVDTNSQKYYFEAPDSDSYDYEILDSINKTMESNVEDLDKQFGILVNGISTPIDDNTLYHIFKNFE